MAKVIVWAQQQVLISCANNLALKEVLWMEVNQYSAQKTKEKIILLKRSRKPTTMKIATCSCGEKILVVPDLAAMNKAVDNHLSKHNCDVLFLLEAIFKAICQ